jgi:hypothetical protein
MGRVAEIATKIIKIELAMKTNVLKIALLISVLSIIAGCKEDKCSRVPQIMPALPEFFFSIVDEKGNDLFFGKDSIYNNPHNVKIQSETLHYWSFSVSRLRNCFRLFITDPRESFIFYTEFISDRVDTIKIESRFMGWHEHPDGCWRIEAYEIDYFFNDLFICTFTNKHHCYEIHKIELK